MEIQEIKTRLSIAQVLEHYNMRADKNARMCCPFHDDKTPSMQVYEKTNTVYCFSANCKTHGHSLDVIDFIMHQENVTKHEALKKATQMIVPSEVSPSSEMSKNELLLKLYNYFRNGLRMSPVAKEYCQSRGLDWELVEMGFNGGQYHHGSRKDEKLIKACLQYGLLSEHKNPSRTGEIMYNIFGKNCIVFALRNTQNQVVSLYFRSILSTKNRNAESGEQGRHFYTRDRQGLYPNYPPHYAEKLILTESIIDAASLLQNPNIAQNYSVLALYGTNGLTDEHQKAIKAIKNLEEIILFFDGDQAGREAVKKYAPMLKEMVSQIKVSVVNCPENEDINSLLISHEKGVLEHLLETRTSPPTLRESDPDGGATEPNLSFSNEEKKTTEIVSPSGVRGLDTSNPFNLIYRTKAITYCIKGGIKGNLDSLKISVQIINNSQKSDYRAKLDLYENKQVVATAQATAEKLHLNHNQIESDLGVLTSLLEDYREQQEPTAESEMSKVKVSESNTRACVNFLQQEKLLNRFNDLLGESGIIGEENNRLLLFVIASSYMMPSPLHALVQGSSGSGKTHLLLKIANLMPQEDTITLTRVTENSFYNYGENDLKNKLLCMEDLDGMKDEAFLAFRELQSRGMLTSSTSIKDETGNIKGVVKTVRGPVATLSATTKGEIYEDNMSRCFLVAVDETAEQTQRIISYQNQLSAGLIDCQKQEQIKLFTQNCLRLLRPYEVVNPFAGRLNLPPEAHKIRRLNELYQVFVRQITLLNQFQRQKDDKGRLIATKEDLQTACQIMFESIVLKVDELDGSLRLFYENLKAYLQPKGKEFEFTRREVRQALGMSKTQQHSYFTRLEELEYIKQSGGYVNRGLHYKIAHWDSYTALRAKIKDHLESQLAVIS
jgi:DNA primase catalytic core